MASNARDWSRWRRGAAVVGGYIVLSVIATWPLAQHFRTHVPGSDEWAGRRLFCESSTNLWRLWWFRHAAVELGQNPFDCTHTFYPYGANLRFDALAPLHCGLGVVLQTWFTLPATQNVILLLNLVAAGGFTFVLARHLGLSSRAAFLAGAIFAFSPGPMSHLYAGIFEMMATCWLPATLWLLLRLLAAAQWTWRSSVPLGLVLGVVIYTSHYSTVFCWELIALTAGVQCWMNRQWSLLKRLVPAFVVAVLVGSPIIWAFIGASGPRPDLVQAAEFDWYSADLAGFFVPSFMHPFFGSILRGVHLRLNPDSNYLPQETTMFLGLSVLALAACGIVRHRAATRAAADRAGELESGLTGSDRPRIPTRLLITIFCVFLILSMGSHLKICGLNTRLPLPSLVYSHLPILRNARAPGRHIVVVMLALSLLAAGGWDSIRRGWLRSTLIVSIAFEFIPVPIPLYDAAVPEVYQRLRDAPGKFAVLELPFGLRDGTVFLGDSDSRQLLAQTVHRRPIVAGEVARLPSRMWQRILATPVIGTLLDPAGPAAFERRLEFDRQQGPAFFSRWGIRAVVVHPVARGGPAQQYIEQIFAVKQRESFSDGTELLWLE